MTMDKLRFVHRLMMQPIKVTYIAERYAGHSKWQNIRHIKAANDAKKGKTISKFCNQIRRCAYAGGFDPKVNDKLAELIALALNANVPKDTISRTIDKAKSKPLHKEIMEIFGPGGCFLLLDIETPHISETRHDIKKIIKSLKDARVGIAKGGAVKHAFEEKGAITISKKDNSKQDITLEKSEEIAIEAGAEEVFDDEENPDSNWMLKTDTTSLFEVKSVIEKTMPSVNIINAEVRYFPVVKVALNDADMEKASVLVEKLQEMDEINALYDNIA